MFAIAGSLVLSVILEVGLSKGSSSRYSLREPSTGGSVTLFDAKTGTIYRKYTGGPYETRQPGQWRYVAHLRVVKVQRIETRQPTSRHTGTTSLLATQPPGANPLGGSFYALSD